MPPQTYEFDIHKNQVRINIERQIGNFGRAILEAVQNSADAGATECSVLLNTERAIISDNGKGMPDLETITTCFRVFGQPHTEEEAKLYGAFRMGRGQLFAAGRNTWRTCQYEIVVDYKEKLGFDLHDNLPHNPGCSITIDFYKPLTEVEVTRVITELSRDVRYMSALRITANGHVLNTSPEASSWDHKTGWYYFSANRTGQLHVYNMGLRVVSYPNNKLHIGGELVSTVPLALISARNDLMDSCPVWTEFRKNVPDYVRKLEEQVNIPVAKARRRQSQRSSSDRPRDTLQTIAIRHREPTLRWCAETIRDQLTEFDKQNPPLAESRRVAALAEIIAGKVPRLDRQPVFLCRLPDSDNFKWYSFNAMHQHTKGRAGHRIVYSDTGTRAGKLATKSKRAAIVHPVRTVTEADLRWIFRIAAYISGTKNRKRHLQVCTEREIESLARDEAMVTEVTRLSGLETAVLKAYHKAADNLCDFFGLASYSWNFYFADLGAFRVVVRNMAGERWNRLDIIIDRDSLKWTNTLDGWMQHGTEFIEALIQARAECEDIKKYAKKEEWVRALWWQCQRRLCTFATEALRVMASSYSHDIEDQVRLAAAQQLEQVRYLEQVSHRQDLTRATIQQMKDHLVRIETWYARSVKGNLEIGRHGVSREYLPDNWDQDCQPDAPESRAEEQDGTPGTRKRRTSKKASRMPQDALEAQNDSQVVLSAQRDSGAILEGNSVQREEMPSPEFSVPTGIGALQDPVYAGTVSEAPEDLQ